MTRIAWCWIALALAGCPSYSTYGYQYRMQQQFGAGEEPAELPNIEAKQLLANAKTVAFYPPDTCINADTVQDKKASQELRASCGALMSKLERAAERAGYEVLSWQNLRGGKRAIDFAREANVDVLFEINEFVPQIVDDSAVQRTLTFFERSDSGIDTPLNTSDQVAQTCRDYAAQADPPRAAALTGTIDIKTVAVADGRDRWHYRKTEQQSAGREYPRMTFTAPKQESLGTRLLLGLGSGALGAGIALAIIEATSTDDPLTPQNEKFSTGGLSTGLIVGGVLAIGGAIAVHYAVGGSKPDPATVLCNGKFASVVAPTVQTQPITVGPMSAQHTFQETTVTDPLAKIRETIQTKMIAQFIEILIDARANRRTAAPPPSPPPAQP